MSDASGLVFCSGFVFAHVFRPPLFALTRRLQFGHAMPKLFHDDWQFLDNCPKIWTDGLILAIE